MHTPPVEKHPFEPVLPEGGRSEKHSFERIVPKEARTEKHPFEPFVPKGARVLFLGSFPPQEHRWCMPFYYPNWINDFWRIMGLIHFGDKNHFCITAEKRFDEAAIRAFCTQQGLAFYDTACEVRRLKDNASDAFLEVVTPTDLSALLGRMPLCDTIVTTGQKATEVLAGSIGCPVPPVGGWVEIALQGATAPLVGERGKIARQGVTAPPVGGWVQIALQGATAPLVGERVNPYGGDSRPIRFWRMPSTSRAYPLPLEKKAEAYRQLFK